MREPARIVLLMAAVACAVQTAETSDEPPQPAIRAAGAAADVHAQFQYAGYMSCASASCHGSLQGDPDAVRTDGDRIGRNEFFSWFENDPHRRAWETLESEVSAQIIEKLATAATEQQRELKRQEIVAACLACHSTSGSAADVEWKSHGMQPARLRARPQATELLTGGVSCEACHGPASEWGYAHYRQAWNPHDGRASGLVETKNLLTRARKCAECHVGGLGRNMNHDMIAAGHPVLKFEMAAYHALLPKHWNDRRERTRTEDLELRLWAAGQIATAEASLELLKERTSDAPNAVWPEFAEYDCYACHHDLLHPSWRQESELAIRRAGTLPWGTWSFPLLAQFGGEPLEKEIDAFREPWNELKGLMELSVVADREGAHVSAEATLAGLQQWASSPLLAWANVRVGPPTAQSAPIGPAQLADLLTDPADPQGNSLVTDWDTAAKLYLAAVAIDVAMRERQAKANVVVDDQHRRALQRLRDALAFPQNYSSPQQFGVPQEDSSAPRDIIRQDLVKILLALKQRSN